MAWIGCQAGNAPWPPRQRGRRRVDPIGLIVRTPPDSLDAIMKAEDPVRVAPAPVRLFCVYHPADQKYFDELHEHLVPLVRKGTISISHSGSTPAGRNAAEQSGTAMSRE